MEHADRKKPAQRPSIVATICARAGSKGVPRKNLRLLDGKPLIGRAVEQALATKVFDRVVASTDDPEMARVAAEFGAEVPFLRPAELARDHTNKWDVFRHLVSQLEASGGRRVGVVADLDTGAAYGLGGGVLLETIEFMSGPSFLGSTRGEMGLGVAARGGVRVEPDGTHAYALVSLELRWPGMAGVAIPFAQAR